MNLNGDEKRIRQLFREMGRDDESRTPEFAVLIAAARSRAERSKKSSRLFAISLAVSVAIVLLIAMSIAWRQARTQTQGEPRDQVAEELPSTETAPAKPASTLVAVTAGTTGTTAERAMPRRIRRKRHSDDLAIRMKTLFAWQSPTASLLKAPGDEMLKSLPRLGESLQSIKIFLPNEFN